LPQPAYEEDTPLFTCLSCSIAFPNPEDQRAHYRSDLHRYNMKRRVANLPPVKPDVFNAKILERTTALAQQQQSTAAADKCHACDKKFASQNAYTSHINSKKHKENVAKLSTNAAAATAAAAASRPAQQPGSADAEQVPLVFRVPKRAPAPVTDGLLASAVEERRQKDKVALVVDENATDEQIEAVVDAKLASSRRIDASKECLFCAKSGFADLDQSLAHMSKTHGFFIPDSEYLVDLTGLVSYLADKISIGNICLYCNARGKSFHNLESVRNHMLDKFHCKIAYTDQEDQLELADFYDFTTSYPPEDEWEDEDADAMDVDADDAVTVAGETDTGPEIRYGDSELELVLPSGARLGHRSLRRYYQQSLRPDAPASTSADDPARRYVGGGALARRLIAESGTTRSDTSLVAGRHGQLIKARSAGHAREARKHITRFRDQSHKEQYRTRVAYTNNNQKHFRDPLLQ
jgi:pre-60S factor REI1